jgi:hypothetical protein
MHASLIDSTQFPVTNARVLVLNTRLETPRLEPYDITLQMSEYGGTFFMIEAGSPKKLFARVPVFGAIASHASDGEQVRAWLGGV